jgi:hypothetical protein
MSRTVVLIPAAGSSVRYQKAGYSQPKQTLVIRHNRVIKTMLAHVEDTVIGFDIMIGLRADSYPPKDIRGEIIPIEETKGQSDTLFQMVRFVPDGRPVLVLDCDMLLEPADILQLDLLLCSWDVAVAVTKTFDPNASRIDTFPYPTWFVEKEPISEYGIVGARAFRSKSKLYTALSKQLSQTMTEPYLSTAINFYDGKKIALEINKFSDWGTPERLAESGAEIL